MKIKLLCLLFTSCILQPLIAMEGNSLEKRRKIHCIDQAEQTRLNDDLISASMDGDCALIENLLDQGADIEAVRIITIDHLLGWQILINNNSLDIAVQNDHEPACRLLIKRGAIPANKHFFWAAKMGSIDICKLLIGCNGINVNAPQIHNNNTPLILAAAENHHDLCQWLLDHGADISAHNNNGTNALMKAAMHGHKKVCALLIKNGAKIDAQDEDGSTALQYAAGSGCYQICELLLRHGANPNAKDGHGVPTLFDCLYGPSSENSFKCAEILLRYGANPNVIKPTDPTIPNQHNTVLMAAAYSGELAICELLLQWHANHEYQNQNGESALSQAQFGQISQVNEQDPEGIDYAGVVGLLNDPAKIRETILRGAPVKKFSRQFDSKNICKALMHRQIGKK